VLIPGAEHAQVTHLCVAGKLNVASERGGVMPYKRLVAVHMVVVVSQAYLMPSRSFHQGERGKTTAPKQPQCCTMFLHAQGPARPHLQGCGLSKP
jgi:hypothetical protein